MAFRQWQKRPKRGEPATMPRWMASMDELSPAKALGLGLALSGANPKNLALSLVAGGSIAQAGLDGRGTAAAVAVFVAVGSLSVVGALVWALVAPQASQRPLAAVREFLADHNAAIMMVVLGILGVKLLGDAIASI